MGKHMAINLVKKGHKVVAFDSELKTNKKKKKKKVETCISLEKPL